MAERHRGFLLRLDRLHDAGLQDYGATGFAKPNLTAMFGTEPTEEDIFVQSFIFVVFNKMLL